MDLGLAAGAESKEFRSKIVLRILPPEMTLEELKEEIECFLPYINHLHFIPGKAPSFYPSLSDESDSGKSTATKVQATKGVITFSTPGKRPGVEQTESPEEKASPEEILNQKIQTEEYYVRALGGRLSSAYINFTQADQLLLFAREFDGKIVESSRGRHYRTVVRFSSIPGAYLQESLRISETYIGSLQDSPLFVNWAQEQKMKETAEKPASSSLTFDQQTELLLEQERQLHPWKHDPSFFQKTPLMTFLVEAAQKEAERQKEIEKKQKERKDQEERERRKKEQQKKLTKKKEAEKLEIAPTAPNAPLEASKFRIKPRKQELPKKEESIEKPPNPPKEQPIQKPQTFTTTKPAKEQKEQLPKKFSTAKESKWAAPVPKTVHEEKKKKQTTSVPVQEQAATGKTKKYSTTSVKSLLQAN